MQIKESTYPIYRSQDAERVASNCLFNGTSLINAVFKVAEQTSA